MRADPLGMEAVPLHRASPAPPPTAAPTPKPPPEVREPRDHEGETTPPREDTADISPRAEQALTEQERKQVEELRRRDREVRQHEQAHKAAAGPHAKGGPVFEYEEGPDGQQYAVSGHVDVDLSEVQGDPAATIRKMETIRRAAMAPAEPSSQDRQVAAQATKKAQEARMELARETEQLSGLDVYA